MIRSKATYNTAVWVRRSNDWILAGIAHSIRSCGPLLEVWEHRNRPEGYERDDTGRLVTKLEEFRGF